MNNNIKMNLTQTGKEGVESIHLAQGTDQWQRSVVCMAKNIQAT